MEPQLSCRGGGDGDDAVVSPLAAVACQDRCSSLPCRAHLHSCIPACESKNLSSLRPATRTWLSTSFLNKLTSTPTVPVLSLIILTELSLNRLQNAANKFTRSYEFKGRHGPDLIHHHKWQSARLPARIEFSHTHQNAFYTKK